MKKILLLSILVALAGCDNRPIDQREYSIRSLTGIPELSDCSYIKIDDIRIIRCPNSSTTTNYDVQSGKTKKRNSVTVVDEVQK
jgi:hypothetical protein